MVPFVVSIAYLTGWLLLWIALKVLICLQEDLQIIFAIKKYFAALALELCYKRFSAQLSFVKNLRILDS